MKDYKLKLRNLHVSYYCCLLWIHKTRPKIKPIYECRSDGRLQTKKFTEGWVWDLDAICTPSRLRLIRKSAALTRMFPTLDLSITVKAARRKWNSTLSCLLWIDCVCRWTKGEFFFGTFWKKKFRCVSRVYRNGCRYNEKLNTKTGGSKTSHTHWITWVNI